MSASGGGSVMSDDDDDLEQRPPTYCPPEFIEPEEAQRRAVSLIRALGRDHALLVTQALGAGYTAGAWRVLSALERELEHG